MADKALADAQGLVERKLKFAKMQGTRFMDRVKTAHDEIHAALADLDQSDAPTAAFVAQATADVAAQLRGFQLEAARKDLDDDKDWLKRKLKYAKDQGTRFMDRVESTLAEMETRLGEMSENVIYGELEPLLNAYIEEQRGLMKALLMELKFADAKKSLDDDKDYVARRMKDAKSAGTRFMDRVESNHQQASDRLDEMMGNELYLEMDDTLPEYIETQRAAMRALLVELKYADAKKDLDDDKDWLNRKLKYAKDQGTRFMDRVESTLAEMEDRLGEMTGKELYLEMDATLPDFVDAQRAAMKALLTELKYADAKKDLDDDKDWIKRKLSYAKDQGTRFMDRVESTLAEMETRLDEMMGNELYFEMDETLPEYIDEQRGLMKALMSKLQGEVLAKDVEDEFDRVKRRLSDAESNIPRFLDRAEKSLAEAAEILDTLWTEEKFFGIDLVEDFLAEFRPVVLEKQRDVAALIMADDVDRQIYDPKSSLRSAFSTLDRLGIYNERALDEYNRGQDQLLQLEDEHPEWEACPAWRAFKSKYAVDSAKFVAAWDVAVAEDAAKKTTEAAWDTLGFVSSYRTGSFDRAYDYLHEARDLAETMGRDPELVKLRSVQEFLSEKFWPKWNETSASMQDEMYKTRVERMIDDFMAPMSHAESYFKSSHEGQALQYYDEAKGKLQEMLEQPDPVLLARPEIPPAIQKFNEKAAAFEKLFHDTVVARERKAIFDSISQNMSNAESYFKSHHESQAMQYFDDAKKGAAEARFKFMSAGPVFALGEAPKVDDEAAAFFDNFDKKTAAFEEEFLARRSAEKKKSMLEDAKNHADWTLTYLDSNPDMAVGYRRDAMDNIAAIEADESLISQADVVAAVAAVRATIATFDERFVTKVVMAQFKDKTGSANIVLGEAEFQLKAAHYENCGAKISEARSHAAELMAAPEIGKVLEGEECPLRTKLQADVDAFDVAFREKADAVDTACRNAITDAAFKDKTENCTNALSFAESAGKNKQFDTAMRHFDSAMDHRDELAGDAALFDARCDAVCEFLEAFDKKAEDFRTDIVAQAHAEELKRAISTMEDNLSHAHSYFNSHHESQALEYLAQAKAAAAELATDRRYDGIQQLDEAMERFRNGVAAFTEAFDARRKATKVKSARSDATDNISHAESYFKSGRRDQSLDYLQRGRDAVDAHKLDGELMAEPGAEQWQEEVEARISTFETTFNEAVFAEEVKSLREDCERPLSDVAREVEQGQLARAFGNVALAKERAAAFGSDSKFSRNAAVDEFLTAFKPKCDAAATQVALASAQHDRKKKEQGLGELHSHAVSYFECFRQEQGLDYLQQARDGIEDLRDVLAGIAQFPEEQAKGETFIVDFEKKLGATSDKFQRTILVDEAKKVISAANDCLSTAQFHVKAGEIDRGLESLESAKAHAVTVGDARYFGLPEAEEFFKTWSERVDAFVKKVENVLFAEAIRNATEAIKDKVRSAESFSKQRQFAQALEQAQEATALLEDLKLNPDIGRADSVVAFRTEQVAKVAGLKQTVIDELYKDEVKQVCRTAASDVATAESLLKSFAAEQALAKQQEAKASVATLRTDERYASADAAKSTVAELEPRLVAFEAAFVQAQLQDEARACLAAFQQNAAEYDRLQRRGILASEAGAAIVANITAAIDETEAGAHRGLLLRCAKVPEAVAAAKAHRVEYASAVVGADAKRACDAAQRGLDGDVKTHLSRGFVDLAAESFAKTVVAPFARAISGPVPAADAPPVQGPTAEQRAELAMLLPDVVAFSKTASEFASTTLLGRATFSPFGDAAASGPGSKKAKGAARPGASGSISSVLGEGIGEPFKISSMAMSADVNPKVFGALKKYNTVCGHINRDLRGFLREINDLGWNTPLNLDKFKKGMPFEVNKREVDWALDSMDTWRRDLSRAIAEAKKDAPDDATTQAMVEAADSWTEQYEALLKRHGALRKIAKDTMRMLSYLSFLKYLLKEGKGCLGVNSNPNRIHLSHRAMVDDAIVGVNMGTQVHDHNVFVLVADQVETALGLLEKASIDGKFLMKDELVEKFKECRTEALKLHPFHCCNVFLNCSRDIRPTYVSALKRFPKARAMLGELLTERYNSVMRRQSMRDRVDFEKERKKHYTFNDPYKDAAPGKHDFDESDDLLFPAAFVVPGAAFSADTAKRYANAFRDTAPVEAASVPMCNRHPKSTHDLAGKIVFGRETLAKSVTAGSSELESAFDANDTIHMRAFWAHAPCDYPIAVNRSGKPVYGPAKLTAKKSDHAHHTLELTLDCFIDGVRVEAPGGRTTATWAQRSRSTDFYGAAMTCRSGLGEDFIESPSDPWEALGNRLRRAYKALPGGDHTVRVDLRFRICPTDMNIEAMGTDKAVFPLQDTPLSAPIATGSFTVTVPSSPSDIKLGRILVPRPDKVPFSRPVAAQIEAAIAKHLSSSSGWGKRAHQTEEVFHVTVTSGWYVTSTEWFDVGRDRIVKEPVEYGVECTVYFYRSPATGWGAEEIAAFDLTALTACTRNPRQEPPFVHVAVGGNETFEPELLPDETLALIKNRCPAATRVPKVPTHVDPMAAL